VFTLRCTRKLLRRLGAKPSSEVVEASTVLGDWYANLLHLRPQQLVLAMNERSLLCVLVPAAPIGSLGERLRVELGSLLTDIGLPTGRVAAERVAMEPMAIGATASRAVLGCMNDAVFQLSHRRAPGVSLRELGLHLADNIYALTDYQEPRRRVLELFDVTERELKPGPRRLLH
jgi:hypothetical protein